MPRISLDDKLSTCHLRIGYGIQVIETENLVHGQISFLYNLKESSSITLDTRAKIPYTTILRYRENISFTDNVLTYLICFIITFQRGGIFHKTT